MSEYEGLENTLKKISEGINADLKVILSKEAEAWLLIGEPIMRQEAEAWEKLLAECLPVGKPTETEARAREIVSKRISQINRLLSGDSL